MQRIVLLGWFCFALLIATPASAANYYVSLGGSDLNSGSAGFPWKTIQMGANTAGPGDTVLVQPGIYDEFVSIQRPGITFRANGSVTNRGTLFVRVNNITIDGFDMTVDGTSHVYSGVYFPWTGVTNCWVINNRIHDTPNLRPAGPISFDSAGYGTNCTQGIVISNNAIYNFGGTGIILKGIGHLAVNNWISNSYGGDAFNVQGRDHIVRGNFSTQIGSGFVNAWGAGNSNFNGTYWDNIALRKANGGASIWTNVLGYAITSYYPPGRSNVFNLYTNIFLTNVIASAECMDQTCPWTMHDNVMVSPFTNSMGSIEHPDWLESMGPLVNINNPMWEQTATNILVERNLIVNCPGGAVFNIGSNWTNEFGRCTDWTFRNNIWARCEVPATVETPHVRIYNNTFYQCCTNSVNSVLAFAFYPTNSSDPRGQAWGDTVKSNAFIGCGGSSGAGWYGVGVAGDITNDWGGNNPSTNVLTNCDYNYVGEIDGTPKDQGTGYPSTNPWRFSEPHGVNGGDPGLVNPSAGDFRLKSGSVLTNGGINIGAYLCYPIGTNGPPRPSGLRVVGSH